MQAQAPKCCVFTPKAMQGNCSVLVWEVLRAEGWTCHAGAAVSIEPLRQGRTDEGWAAEGRGCDFLATESQRACFPAPSVSQLCWLFARRFSELKSQSGRLSPCGAAGPGSWRVNIWLGGMWKGRALSGNAVRGCIWLQVSGEKGLPE